MYFFDVILEQGGEIQVYLTLEYLARYARYTGVEDQRESRGFVFAHRDVDLESG